MSTPNFLRFLVPREWSAEQALLVVELLGQARDAVWLVHGEAMAHALMDDPERLNRIADFADGDDEDDEFPDDGLPF